MSLMSAPESAFRPSGPGVPGTIDVEPFIGYGGFWLRVIAAIIDAVIVSAISAVLGVLSAMALWVPGAFVTSWLYEALMTASRHRATLGKLAVGLKVTDHAGHQLSFARSTGRYFAKYVSLVLLCIGFIMVAFSERKRGLHDLLAGTLVLKRNSPPGGPISATGP